MILWSVHIASGARHSRLNINFFTRLDTQSNTSQHDFGGSESEDTFAPDTQMEVEVVPETQMDEVVDSSQKVIS